LEVKETRQGKLSKLMEFAVDIYDVHDCGTGLASIQGFLEAASKGSQRISFAAFACEPSCS
jgi:hypothetical protein